MEKKSKINDQQEIGKCMLCNKIPKDDYLTLFNNKRIHEACVDKLVLKIEEQEEENNEIYKRYNKFMYYEKETRRRLDSFLGRFFYRETESDFDKYQTQRVEYAEEYLQIEKKINSSKNKLKKIYDYWPTYPPDMDERREEVLEKHNHLCSQNGCYERENLHVHHIKFIKNGGMHKLDNLVVLCEEHHQAKHKHKFKVNFEKNKRSYYSIRLDRINKAIEDNNEITFRHFRFSEKKWISRHIIPKKITKEVYINGELFENNNEYLYVQGHCHLRNENRTFRIDRIRNLKLLVG